MPVYLSRDIPFRQVKLYSKDGEFVKSLAFEKGVLEIDDETSDLLDYHLQRRPDVFRGIVKVDKEAIEEEVQKIREQNSGPTGIVKGGLTGLSTPTVGNLPPEALEAETGSEKFAKEVSKSGLHLTGKS